MSTHDRTAEFEAFAASRAEPLFRSAWLLCGNRADAEDLVQETLAKVYVRMHRRLLPALDNPAAYAQTALSRTFVSRLRRPSNGERPFAELPDRSVGTHADAAELRVDLAEALTALTPIDRAVLVLRYLDDLSVEEVAAQLGLTPGAVRNRSMRALARMREGSLR